MRKKENISLLESFPLEVYPFSMKEQADLSLCCLHMLDDSYVLDLAYNITDVWESKISILPSLVHKVWWGMLTTDQCQGDDRQYETWHQFPGWFL